MDIEVVSVIREVLGINSLCVFIGVVIVVDTHSLEAHTVVAADFTAAVVGDGGCRCATSTPLSAVDDDDGDDEDQTADDDHRRDDNDQPLCYTGHVLDAEQVPRRVSSTNERLSQHCRNASALL